MSCWSVLGLEPGADERSVKRAYARLLKVHRPDEDAEAFQRLREAYDQALSLARQFHDPGQPEGDPWPALSEPAEGIDPPLAEPAARQSAPAQPVHRVEPLPPAAFAPVQVPEAAVPPGILPQQMHAWLEEGRDREVLDAVRAWLTSEWLLPFDRRLEFEQQMVVLVERSHWSPAFFEALSRLMGWDDDLGQLPCEGWRWGRLIERCQDQAWLDALRRTLDSSAERGLPQGRAASFLLMPLSDAQRRRAADAFTQADWQACNELAQALEYQYPEACEQLGVRYCSHWRRWLPQPVDKKLYVGLWALLTFTLGTHSLVDYQGARHGWINALLSALVSAPLMLWIGTAVYCLWGRVARAVGRRDVLISRKLIPTRYYGQGSGLLLVRHLLPLAAGSLAVGAALSHTGWQKWANTGWLFTAGACVVWLSKVGRLGLPRLWIHLVRFSSQNKRTFLIMLIGFACLLLINWLMPRHS